MIELMRTNDSVLLSVAATLMQELGIVHYIADTNMSIMEGSLGIIPRRFLVEEGRFEEARRTLIDAGLKHELRNHDK